MKQQSGKINGWDAAYKENPQQFTEPETICSLLDTIFPKYKVKRILDLGCGNGRHLVYFGKSGYEIFGSDLSLWGLQAANQWLGRENLPSRLSLGDMQYLPFQDASFDAVISFKVIQHNLFADIEATFLEIGRIMRSGGILAIDLLRYDPNSERFKTSTLVEERTYIPASGTEQGMPHHAFTKTEAFHLLRSWKIRFFNTQPDKKHFTIIAQK